MEKIVITEAHVDDLYHACLEVLPRSGKDELLRVIDSMDCGHVLPEQKLLKLLTTTLSEFVFAGQESNHAQNEAGAKDKEAV